MTDFVMPTIRIGSKSKIRQANTAILDQDPRGIVWVFEPPSSKARYCMGVDPSFGIPQWSRYNRSENDHLTDNGAIEIIRIGRPGHPDVQVCEYAAPIDPYDLAAVANSLGRLYAGTDDNEQCLCIIEVYPGPGLPCQREMMEKHGYLHHYVWKYLDTMLPKATASYGWQSSTKSVRDLWIKGIRHISTGKIILHSSALVEEMADCEMDMTKMAAKAVYGTHDDRVRALLMAIWCLPPETQLSRTDGNIVPIEKISTGDSLIGLYGPERVSDVRTRQHTGFLREFRISGQFERLRSTPEHRLLVRHGVRHDWTDASDVQPGDSVLLPRRVGLPKSRYSDAQLYFMGWYLAEGFLFRGSCIRICLGPTESAYAERLKSIAAQWRGGEVQTTGGQRRGDIRLLKLRTSLAVDFSSHLIYRLFLRHLGTGSHHKRLSPDLFNSSGLLPLVRGWLDGDGHVHEGRAKVTTVSWVLARQMRQILLDHGIWCTIRLRHVAERKIEGRTLAPSISYEIGIGRPWFKALYGQDAWFSKQRIAQHMRGFWTNVVAVSDVPYDGPVYDINTSNHTFTASGILVHNCAHDWGFDVELDSTTRAELNESPANWQSSDISADRMFEAWSRRFDEISDLMEDNY